MVTRFQAVRKCGAPSLGGPFTQHHSLVTRAAPCGDRSSLDLHSFVCMVTFTLTGVTPASMHRGGERPFHWQDSDRFSQLSSACIQVHLNFTTASTLTQSFWAGMHFYTLPCIDTVHSFLIFPLQLFAENRFLHPQGCQHNPASLKLDISHESWTKARLHLSRCVFLAALVTEPEELTTCALIYHLVGCWLQHRGLPVLTVWGEAGGWSIKPPSKCTMSQAHVTIRPIKLGSTVITGSLKSRDLL